MSFTFNNKNCESFGLEVEKYPPRRMPEKIWSTYQVPGLNGKVFIPQGGYSNVLQPYEVFVKKGVKSIQQLIAEIAAWLLTPDEPKNLYDSYDPDTIRKAVFTGGANWANSLNEFGRCTLTFDCAPQRYDKTPQISTGTITGGTTHVFTIGNGQPKGNGYIDDIIPICRFWASEGDIITVGEELEFKITNTITSEQTTIKLTCTADMSSDYEIILDMLSGTIYARHRTTEVVLDILSFFSVTLTGSLKMRFTYQVRIDASADITSIKYAVNPRWYKL